jgi:hypothetical protein
VRGVTAVSVGCVVESNAQFALGSAETLVSLEDQIPSESALVRKMIQVWVESFHLISSHIVRDHGDYSKNESQKNCGSYIE